MKDNISAYKAWAPSDALWTAWAKPVLFAKGPNTFSTVLTNIKADWLSMVDFQSIVIVDLPGADGVNEGLALAELGYRPVPLYNGVHGPNAPACIVNVSEVVKALFEGADKLAAMRLRHDAPPAFLLDTNRMIQPKSVPGKYDNRWCVFPQDMPSAAYLLGRGIRRVIVRTRESRVEDDLSHILCRYQEKGIRISLCDSTNVLRDITVSKPSRFASLAYRFSVTAGLKRNAAGGFGAKVPEPTQTSATYVRVG